MVVAGLYGRSDGPARWFVVFGCRYLTYHAGDYAHGCRRLSRVPTRKVSLGRFFCSSHLYVSVPRFIFEDCEVRYEHSCADMPA